MTRARDLADFNFDGKAVTINESSADLDFRVESNGNANMLFVDGGNDRIGLGTNSPSVPLHQVASAPRFIMQASGSITSGTRTQIDSANSDGSTTGAIVFGAVTDNVGTNIQFSTRPASGSLTEAMRIASDGDLLVGKSSDSFATDGTALKSTGEVNFTRTDAVPISLRRSGTAGNLIEFYHDSTTVGKIGIQSSGFYIDGESGHEGIRFSDGAITPRENGSDSDATSDLGATGNQFKDGYFSGTLFAESFTGRADTNTSIQMAGSDIMKFFTGGTERFRVDDSGHLNYACTTISPGLGNTDTGIAIRADSIIAASSASGYVSINRNGDGTRIQFNNSGNTRGTITVTGTTTAYNTSSDRRLKSNIQDAASASAKIDAMKVRQFDWTEDGKHQDYGMIAQELQSIEPLAVSGSEDSNKMMGVDYSILVPMLIKEIQELRSRVAALEAS